MAAIANVNGTIATGREATISVFDHGFLFGEGVYETLRTYNGRPFLLDRHLRRLRTSAGMINLDVPLSNEELTARLTETLTAASTISHGPSPSSLSSPTPRSLVPNPQSPSSSSSFNEWYIRILLTRGDGELSYDPAACPTPSVVIIVKPLEPPEPATYEHGVSVVLVSVMRNHPGTVNPLIKSNNLLNNVLAMQEAVRRGAFEGVMRNYRGEISECTTANIFVVKDGLALTPPLDSGLLAGITREFLFELGPAHRVPVRDAVLQDDDLFGADEVFLTSTTRELVPIVRVDDRVIGDGKPGPVTRKLLKAFRAETQALTKTVSSRR
jgi:branched-chain amino acid aminotransferase